jgi:hypothetical protein
MTDATLAEVRVNGEFGAGAIDLVGGVEVGVADYA